VIVRENKLLEAVAERPDTRFTMAIGWLFFRRRLIRLHGFGWSRRRARRLTGPGWLNSEMNSDDQQDADGGDV